MAAIRAPSLHPFAPASPSPNSTRLPARSVPFQRCSSAAPLGIASVRSLPLPTSALLSYSRRRARSTVVFAALGKYSDAELVPLPSDPGVPLENPAKVPAGPGIYVVYDGDGVVQFIGVARNVAGNLSVHRKTVSHELCRSVKVGVLDEPEPDRTALTEAWKSWMQEHIESTGKIPPGNETGNNTWVRRRQQKPDIRLTPGPHVQLTVPLEELIDRLVKENKVVTFIKGSRNAPQCGFSQRVIGILESQGVDFESVDVLDEEHNRGLRETLKTYSNWPTFPQIFVKGELIGGCDILTSMAEKGELAQLFEK